MRITMRALLTLEVEDQSGIWRKLEVVVDTGASYPTLGLDVAESLNLDVPPPSGTMRLRTAAGLIDAPVHDGELHVRFPQLPGQTFRLKCLFRDQPPDVPPLLGLHNTIDLMTITFDGSSRPHAGAMRPDDGFMGSMLFVVPEESSG